MSRATLVDVQPEEETAEETIENEEENENQLLQIEPAEETQEQPTVPDKYQGKTLEDVVQMHQEAEKLLGKQSGEVGELRSVVDNYIQTQLDTTQQATQEPEEEIISVLDCLNVRQLHCIFRKLLNELFETFGIEEFVVVVEVSFKLRCHKFPLLLYYSYSIAYF